MAMTSKKKFTGSSIENAADIPLVKLGKKLRDQLVATVGPYGTKTGCLVGQAITDFREDWGEDLRDYVYLLRFKSLNFMIRSMPESVQLKRDSSGFQRVHAVAGEELKHCFDLIDNTEPRVRYRSGKSDAVRPPVARKAKFRFLWEPSVFDESSTTNGPKGKSHSSYEIGKCRNGANEHSSSVTTQSSLPNSMVDGAQLSSSCSSPRGRPASGFMYQNSAFGKAYDIHRKRSECMNNRSSSEAGAEHSDAKEKWIQELRSLQNCSTGSAQLLGGGIRLGSCFDFRQRWFKMAVISKPRDLQKPEFVHRSPVYNESSGIHVKDFHKRKLETSSKEMSNKSGGKHLEVKGKWIQELQLLRNGSIGGGEFREGGTSFGGGFGVGKHWFGRPSSSSSNGNWSDWSRLSNQVRGERSFGVQGLDNSLEQIDI